MSDFQTSLIADLGQFAACRDEWNELARDRVFHRWEWMFSWWEQFQSQGELAIVVVKDGGGRWVGIAPWFKSRSTGRGRVVHTIGCGAACSDYVSLAIRPGFERPVTDAVGHLVFGQHASEPFADVDLFELEGHLACDRGMQMLQSAAAENMSTVVMHEIGGAWRSELPVSWDEYESALHKSFRRKTRKAERRLGAAEFAGEVALSPEELDATWSIFANLHQQRRRSLGQAGCFADPKFEQFLKNATLRLGESGRAQINLVRYQGNPITANLEFISGDSVYMYQTGMDPEHLTVEPGHITFTWAIQASIERGFRWFDFLRGDELYKSRWKAVRTPLFRTRIVPNRLTPRIRSTIWHAGRQVRDWTQGLTNLISS
ncbi:MAG: GNAT family N-acetyltransferase [Pirellulaceae bacterium]